MPTPTIPAGNLFMNATTYTGTSATQTITNGVAGQAFQPDLVWMKSRSNAQDHYLLDSVRGATKDLAPNLTNAEATNASSLTAFNSNGYTLGSGGANFTGYTYVGWQWKAGGTAVTNTSGTISSQVSANTTSGFSVVTYTGTGVIATIGHGLGVAPAMMIIKARNAVQGWLVYHQSIGNTGFIYLDQTAAASYSINGWNNTSPTSTVFTTGVNGYTNASGQTQVAYCWTPIAGFSQFGSYTGNGSTDGPFVYTGFRPRFVIFKRSDSTGNWQMIDTSINPYNNAGTDLFANLSNAETSGYAFDILSNGFKQRDNGAGQNASGGTYIYAAFAENPFKYANAR